MLVIYDWNISCDIAHVTRPYSWLVSIGSGARPTKHISIEFEIRWKFRML